MWYPALLLAGIAILFQAVRQSRSYKSLSGLGNSGAGCFAKNQDVNLFRRCLRLEDALLPGQIYHQPVAVAERDMKPRARQMRARRAMSDVWG
jgi:hypothetical protein